MPFLGLNRAWLFNLKTRFFQAPVFQVHLYRRNKTDKPEKTSPRVRARVRNGLVGLVGRFQSQRTNVSGLGVRSKWQA